MDTPEGASTAMLVSLVARVAVLDHDQVYWSLEERALENIAPGDVVFGDPTLKDVVPVGAVYVGVDCDLPGGRYRWNAERRRFEPLAREQRKAEPGAPTIEQAFHDFLKLGPGAPRVKAWMSWFERSFDERKAKG